MSTGVPQILLVNLGEPLEGHWGFRHHEWDGKSLSSSADVHQSMRPSQLKSLMFPVGASLSLFDSFHYSGSRLVLVKSEPQSQCAGQVYGPVGPASATIFDEGLHVTHDPEAQT